MADYGLSKASVIQVLEESGVTPRRQPLSPEQVDLAIRLYEEGRSLATVATIIDSSRESIRRALIQVGVTLRPRSGSRSRGV
jgi:hypothetical protein